MKHLVAACCLLLTFSSLAEAQLGWTLQECEAKYGPASIVVPTGRHFKDASVEAAFKYEGWRIRAAWLPNQE
ncbi:MAG: hypothetical protein ACOYM3_11960 [Terrimicrobiaceae bacterium]